MKKINNKQPIYDQFRKGRSTHCCPLHHLVLYIYIWYCSISLNRLESVTPSPYGMLAADKQKLQKVIRTEKKSENNSVLEQNTKPQIAVSLRYECAGRVIVKRNFPLKCSVLFMDQSRLKIL